MTQDGQVSLNVDGARNIGRRGEPQALKTLRQRLQAGGLGVSIQTTARDDRGEDAILSVGSVSYTVHFVTSPSVPEFWREASVSSAVTRVQAEQAVQWLRSSLEMKASSSPREQRVTTLLAIDVRHAGVLASKSVIDAYLTMFTPPAQEFAFASVWIVGPTPQHCARLGEGRPYVFFCVLPMAGASTSRNRSASSARNASTWWRS